MRFGRATDLEACGKVVNSEKSRRYAHLGGLSCLRAKNHRGLCEESMGKAMKLDGVACYCCRVPLGEECKPECELAGIRKAKGES